MGADRANAGSAAVVAGTLAPRTELEREGARVKLTFAEVGENEADLGKLRRWREAADVLQDFAEWAARRDQETAP